MEVKVHQEILKQYSKEKYLGELNLFPLLKKIQKLNWRLLFFIIFHVVLLGFLKYVLAFFWIIKNMLLKVTFNYI